MVRPLTYEISPQGEDREGEVVALGKGLQFSDGHVHVGDRVRFDSHSGTGFKIDDDPYLILRDHEAKKVIAQLVEELGHLHGSPSANSNTFPSDINFSPLGEKFRVIDFGLRTDGDLLSEIEDTMPDPEQWLNSPNGQLGGRKPIDLIGTPTEKTLRDLILAVKYLAVS